MVPAPPPALPHLSRRRSLGLVVATLLACIAWQPSPVAAATPIWTITEVTGTAKLIIRGGGQQTVSAQCPQSQTAISGYVNASAPDDLRRVRESTDFGPASTYSVALVDFTDGSSTITVSATVRCVPTSYFGLSTTVSHSFGSNGNLAQGTVTCPTNFLALSASITYGGSGSDRTLLTSAPTFARTGWEARAYTTSGDMTLTVRCVPAADMAGARSYTHSDAVGWGAVASASCPAGLDPVIGGTVHVGGDSGAITIFPKPTATGWISTTLSLSTGNMQTTVVCMPDASPTAQLAGSTGISNVNSATWTFSASDPASAGGYTMTMSCTFFHQGVPTGPEPCSSPVTQSGLSDGTHQISVQATTSDGRTSNAPARTLVVDTVAPTVVFDDAPGTVRASASPTFGLTVTDANTVGALSCAVDFGPSAPCTVPTVVDYRGARTISLSGLTDGSHTLHVRPTDAATNAATYDLAFTVDTVVPTVAMVGPTQPFELGLSSIASWTSQDTGSGVTSYSVRSQQAAHNGDFGAWSAADTVPSSTTSRPFQSLSPGSTYCFSVSATDAVGNASPWATSRCTAVPLDDRSLTRSKGWKASTPSGWFQGTAVSSKRRGQKLATTASVARLALVALTCPRCGKVQISVGAAKVGKVNLKASTKAVALITVPTFELRSGRVTVKVLSKGKLVQIDALGLSQV